MAYSNTPEFYEESDRINERLGELSVDTICALSCASNPSNVIAEEEEDGYIVKMAQLIESYRYRDRHDSRDEHIRKLEDSLDEARSTSDFYQKSYYASIKDVKHLKAALADTVAVLQNE